MKYVLVAMPQVLWFLLTPTLLLSQPVPALAAAPVFDMAPPMLTPPRDCPSKCGNVDIPYPFGIGDNCSWPGFTLTCNHSLNPPRPYLGNITYDTNVEVDNITLETGQMRVFTPVTYICYNSSNTTEYDNRVASASWRFNLTGSAFLISQMNKFTAIGCSTMVSLQASDYLAACVTTCVSLEKAASDGQACAGLGCCESKIQSNLSSITLDVITSDLLTHSDNLLPVWKYSPCSHAFVAEKGWYKFSRKDLNGTGNNSYASRVGERSIPLVLDWAITNNGTCPPSPANPVAPACVSNHSYCTNSTERQGYLCNCSTGYIGNPYRADGCKNINECEHPEKYPCYGGSKCHDTEGGYKCKCRSGYRGDGKTENGCQPIFPKFAVEAVVATFCAILLGVFIRRGHKARKRRRFFDKNGGNLLKSMDIKIFTEEQLDKITNSYSTIIGDGSFGEVFMGTIMDDNQRVAVKRSITKGKERHNKEDLANEIKIQLRINHTNLVRLVGCCLETDVPMLVFEFIPKGSLDYVLHGPEKHILSLPARLDIAIGSAEALTYMHSHASEKILHGDVKSGNILLDDNFQPKISDFGSSKHELITRYAKWSVMGDMNYIDPTYIKTGDFTEKSDVYSFGVVLLELITRKKPKYDGSNSLSINFVKSCNEGTRRVMYDQEILSPVQPHYMECLDMFSEIAVQCLKEDVDDRPTMTQVVEQLKLVKLRAREAEVIACGPILTEGIS